tara:strand:- start:850 stop:1119 length:270 start_codon:yes stop_codon:yes gene_type:complete
MTAIERTNIPWRELPHLRISEAAEIAGISRRAMERHIDDESLEIRRIGQVRFITVPSFCCWLGEAENASPTPATDLSTQEREVIRRLSR